MRGNGTAVAPEAEASPQPDGNALAETPETEADGILSPWAEPEPEVAPTPDPERETAPVASTWMGGGETVDGFSVKDTSESGVNLYEELQIDPDVHVKRDGSPVVLLYSTHASESFLLSDTDWYYTDDETGERLITTNYGSLDSNDKVKVGNSLPKVSGGFQSDLTWRDLSLSMSFAYAIGNTPAAHQELPFADEGYPLVPLLFHGFVLYNACRTTINARPGTDLYLQNIAAGGLPLIYFYQRFRLCTDPLNSGNDDFTVSPPEMLRQEAATLKRIAEDTKRISPLQTVFLSGFSRLSPTFTRTEFEDGSSLYVNWSDETTFTPEGLPVPAKDFLVVRQVRQEN